MYEEFYGIKEKPFGMTPDPRFIYFSKKHKECFAHLLYAIKNQTGFVLITGEVGTGKTLLYRTFLTQLDSKIEVALIFNPYLSAIELIKSINKDLGISSDAQTRKELIDELNNHLLNERKKGKTVILIIDEAQNLSPELLEQIRLISNLETDQEKLIQIMLLGQPELRSLISKPNLRQLNQRIGVRYHLSPLNQNETMDYICHRLKIAGNLNSGLFTPSALKLIYKNSKGIPRLINFLCDRALLAGYTMERKVISRGVIKKVLHEDRNNDTLLWYKNKFFLISSSQRLFLITMTTVILVMAGFFMILSYHLPYSSERLPKIFDSTFSKLGSVFLSSSPKKIEEKRNKKENVFSLIINQNNQKTREDAISAILKSWGKEISKEKDINKMNFNKIAQNYGMRCSIIHSNINHLKLLNFPCLLKIFLPGETMPRYLALIEIKDDIGIFAFSSPNIRKIIPIEKLEEVWYGTAYVFWVDFEKSLKGFLKYGEKGMKVAWLQEKLGILGFFKSEKNGIFDENTQNAVYDFQRMYHLNIDGIVGPLTRMTIYSALNYPTPKLIKYNYKQSKEKFH